MLPLCTTFDPGRTSAISLVEPRGPGLRPRLLLVRTIPAAIEKERGPDAWAERAFHHFEDVARLATGRRVLCRYELTIGSKSGALGQARLHMRRGLLLALGADAGAFRLADAEYFMVQTWTSILGVPAKKQGEGANAGWHRIGEAEALVECETDTFRGLGEAAVDAAEAVLMGAALARIATGEWTPKARAKKAAPRARRTA